MSLHDLLRIGGARRFGVNVDIGLWIFSFPCSSLTAGKRAGGLLVLVKSGRPQLPPTAAVVRVVI